uniref:Uncharacterized protein n=1 Tax=Anguilla anguilla TaxID=7936 RepID=A0A0E9S8U1_ANGAN
MGMIIDLLQIDMGFLCLQVFSIHYIVRCWKGHGLYRF